jgi:hypothetical protein
LPSGSENQADAMLEALLPLQRLTRRGLAILLLHHPRKQPAAGGMAARGSGALTGFADILVEMHWQGEPAGPDRRRLLSAAVERGELRQEGTGTRAEPFRYWLPPEERWEQDQPAEQS